MQEYLLTSWSGLSHFPPGRSIKVSRDLVPVMHDCADRGRGEAARGWAGARTNVRFFKADMPRQSRNVGL
jgi:hypothetical protein